MAYEQDRILNGTDSKSIIKKLEDELEKTRQRLINQETANLSYKQRIEELEKGRAKKQTEKELYLEKTIDELRGIIREKTNEANGNLIEISILNENIVEKTNEINRNESLISNLREKIELQKAEIYGLEDKLMSALNLTYPDLSSPELTSQEKMGFENFSTLQGITPKSSKTYKLFGIPVFSINNK
jgi:chromosome segregation ATPase